jgi:hypothetical protein
MKSNGLMSHHVRFNEARSLVMLKLGVMKLIYEKENGKLNRKTQGWRKR